MARLIVSNGFFAKTAIGLFFSMVALAPARADVYQDAITKAFPGFQILSRAEFTNELQREFKRNPGLITGRFNDDEFEDFAAIIRSDVKRTFRSESTSRSVSLEYEYYDGKVVVCHGSGTGQYRCQVLREMQILLKSEPVPIPSLPYELYLRHVKPGKVECSTSGADETIALRKNSIGWVLVDRGGGVYIYQPDGRYRECIGPWD